MNAPSSTKSTEPNLLLETEVVARYRGQISAGTLRNWRSLRIGPPYIKIGKAVLYSEADLIEWDRANTYLSSKAVSDFRDR